MTTSQDLFTLVVNELHLTPEGLKLFTEPNVIYRRYCKQVIRTMNKTQFGLLKTVVTFPPNAKTVAQMQNILIEFLEHKQQYQGEEYRAIWLKLAHKAYLDKQKVQIIDYGTPVDVNQILQARFENIFQQHENQEHETLQNEPQRALQLDDDGPEIRDLGNRIMRLVF